MLRTQLAQDLKTALLAKDKMGVHTIRLILSTLKDKDINARSSGNQDGISDTEILSMMQSMIKQRRESIKLYEQGNRLELAAQEKDEISVIEKYLPQQMDQVQVTAIIDGLLTELNATSVKDMGKVMGALKGKYQGQIDMTLANQILKEKLA